MYQGRTFTREQVFVCGDYLDGDIYPVFQPPGKRRKKCKPTSEIQARLNQKHAERSLTRIVHTNFTPDDYALHLTYHDTPQTEDEAKRLVRNYLRALRRRYAALGLTFKYVLSTEYGKKGGRIHHHLILSGGFDRDEIERMWEYGYANTKRLQFREDGVTGLSHYIAKERKGAKRWSGSRNLEKPACAQYDGRVTMEELDALAGEDEGAVQQWLEERFPDFEAVCCDPYRNNINRGVYIHFEMRRRSELLRGPRGGARL